MLRALFLSFAQLRDPAILRVLAKSIALTLVVFAALFAGFWMSIDGIDPCGWFGWQSCVIGDATAGVATVLVALLSLWFLFPPIAIGVVSLFSDAVVDAVEARHYPGARATRPIGIGEAAGLALRSAGRLILWNLLALPGYLLLMVTGVGPLILFLAINAIALGRDLSEMVAVRHLGKEERKNWLKGTLMQRVALGALTTGAFLIPFFNLFAPVLGAAMATHIFHSTRRAAG